MTFTSWQFGVFVAVVFVTYYSPQVRSFQVQWLVLASLLFYGYGQPELLPLVAIAVLGAYLFLILAMRDRSVWLPVGILFNLLLLAFFKYKFLLFDPASSSWGWRRVDRFCFETAAADRNFLLRIPPYQPARRFDEAENIVSKFGRCVLLHHIPSATRFGPDNTGRNVRAAD